MGQARPRGPDARAHRPHDRGARGIDPAAQGSARTRGGARDLKKSRGLLREAEPVRFRFIAAEKASHSVTILCRCLQVARSGFYAWQRRPESAHARRDRHLRVLVRASHDASRRAYGRPRIWKDLVEEGERVSEKRVGRLMREEGVVARPRRRFKATTMSDHDQPVAANLLDRQFEAP